MATILIIDDSDAQRAEIRKAVRDSGLFDEILEAGDGIHGLKQMLDVPVDVVLCDLDLPGLDGEKLLRVKDSGPGGRNTPFLFLTASRDEERKARLLEDGASDAISKPFHQADLVARLRLHLKVKRLQDALQAQNSLLAQLSAVDELTGLSTRRYVQEFLAIEFLRAQRYRGKLTLMMADLDGFKAANDAHGHPAGDVVLRGVAGLLRARLRAYDVAGRFGGDEIAVVLPQTAAEGAVALAEQWRRSVEATAFDVGGGERVSVTLSIGIAEYGPFCDGPDDVISAADEALYAAKQQGRNCVVVHAS